MAKPASITVVESLCAYLRTEIPSLQVIDEFPDYNENMTFPTLSVITSGNVDYTNLHPYILSRSENETDPDKDDVIYATGQYDFRLQLDLWTEYKDQRGEYFELIKDALNKQFINSVGGDMPKGLSLTLLDYHNVIARYDQVGYTYMDGENESQRSEWRVKIDLLVSFVEAKLKEGEPKIIDAKIVHKIKHNVIIPDTEPNGTDETIIF